MKKRKKNKAKNHVVPIICIIVIILMIVVIIRNSNKKVNMENTIDSQSIINQSYDKENNVKTIEIKTNIDELNSIIMTNDMIEKMKNNSSEYDITLKEALENNQLSNRDNYNIKKAIELKYVNEDTKLYEYYWKITGFDNLNRLIEFCEEAFNSIETEN